MLVSFLLCSIFISARPRGLSWKQRAKCFCGSQTHTRSFVYTDLISPVRRSASSLLLKMSPLYVVCDVLEFPNLTFLTGLKVDLKGDADRH